MREEYDSGVGLNGPASCSQYSRSCNTLICLYCSLSGEEAVKGRSRIGRSRKMEKEVGMRLTLKKGSFFDRQSHETSNT